MRNAESVPTGWRIIKDGDGKGNLQVASCNLRIAEVFKDGEWDKAADRVAALIIAAPDLLAVVEVLLETPEMGGRGGVDYLRLEKAARAAIAKARGSV